MEETRKCNSCGAWMQFAGEAPFRIGGTGGGWKLLFGEFAELGEQMLPLYIYVCPECGKIELYANEKTKQRLLRQR